MGGKRQSGPTHVGVKNRNGSTTILTNEVYGAVKGIGSEIGTGDLSTLDRQELGTRLDQELTNKGQGFKNNIKFWNNLGQINKETKAAIEGKAPKYRYRKYLDQVSMLQQDQPGQALTVLSKGGGASGLGGGIV